MNSASADFRELTFDEISDVNGGILPVLAAALALITPSMAVTITCGMIALVAAVAPYGFNAGKTQAERDNRADERRGTGGGLTPPK
jgi:hypothetical protein